MKPPCVRGGVAQTLSNNPGEQGDKFNIIPAACVRVYSYHTTFLQTPTP